MQNLFNKIYKILRNLLSAKSSRHIAIDINSSNVRILELSKQKNHYRIEKIVCESIAAQNKQSRDGKAIVQRLKNIIEKNSLKSLDTAIAISHPGIIAKTITLPHQLQENEIEEFLTLNIEQYISAATDTISFDYRKSNSADDLHQVTIELIAAHRENIDKYAALLEGCGLTAKIIDSEAHALVRANNLLALNYAKTVAIVNLENEKILVVISAQSKLIYAQEYLAENHILRDAQTLAKQIYANLQSCLAIIKRSIDTIMLCGTHAELEGLVEYLQNISNIRTNLANPFLNMPCANDAVNKAGIQTTPGMMKKSPAMTLCCGLALWEDNDFNLLPSWRHKLHTEKQKKINMIIFFCLILGFLTVTMWHFTLKQKINAATLIRQKLLPQITLLQQEEQRTQAVNNKIAEIKAKLDKMKGLQNNQMKDVALLTNLSQITPTTIYLQNIQKNKEVITINGQTTNLSAITEFMQKISATNLFIQTQIKEIKNTSEQEKVFTIMTNLKLIN